MFAVPGWSVPASKLKLQQEPLHTDASPKLNGDDESANNHGKPKKRKRGQGKIDGPIVTKDNVAELWRKHIEGQGSSQTVEDGVKAEKSKRKRRRKQKGDDPIDTAKEGSSHDTQVHTLSGISVDTTRSGFSDSPQAPANPPPRLEDSKSKQEQRKPKAQRKAELHRSSTLPPPQSTNTISSQTSLPPQSNTVSIINPGPPPLPPTHGKLTPLQTAMRAKLISARFRHINQTLYTTPSTHASSLFSTNPEAFSSYHAGFRAQVASWPQNPVELFVREIKERGAAAGPKSQKQLFKEQKKKNGGKKEKERALNGAVNDNAVKLDPLPRSGTSRTCTILDLGCGDASLHASLLAQASSLNLSLRSFDLAPGDTPNAHLIFVSDIAHLPLPDGEADLAIFCLALMGTNWVDFVSEAARVVRVGGECWVGEVRSRFVGSKEVQKAKAAKGGDREKKRKTKKGAEEDEDEGMGNGKIEVEEEADVAGTKAREQETDVGPFLEVFRRRGFSLKGDVDLGNKMFVRLRFLRVRDIPTVSAKSERRGQPQAPKFIEKEVEADLDPEEEAKVLKPCLYKTR